MPGLSGRKPSLHQLLGQMRGLLLFLLLSGLLRPTQGVALVAQRSPQELTSPGYPEPYPNDQAVTTHIRAPEGSNVRLVFVDFDLEGSPGCAKAWVTVSADGNATAPARLCGPRGSALGPGPGPFVSTGRTLRLQFQAGPPSTHRAAFPHKGFLALYQAVHSSGTVSRTDGQRGLDGTQCVPVCGRAVTPLSPVPPALGSREAEPGSFPWQALTSVHGRGGGALLGDRWVLTAAHALRPKNRVSGGRRPRVDVFLGHADVDGMLASGAHAVRRVHVHPAYRQDEPHDFRGDLALLELRHPVSVGPHLLPVCLPDREALSLAGVAGYVSGFGAQRGWLSTKLKHSGVQVAPRERCEAWLRERGRAEVFSHEMFCAGDEAQDSAVCQGDSGSVFVVWDDLAQHWVATGIVSWGIGCGQGYGFYTKILSYVDWIRGVMEGKD
ncbi:complement C1r subcomponent-like protein isoform X2 [Dipodomys spectabilis]|uniref:complement C1r subcomponent-like protein isoform X2 n=1 Tax=Dipodomys spectabilis TaxID=105255 RepID=UPI001C545EB7|nr:complement C1r subcomponent-like protein isoform X2 [Dipodomys spectabilis]